jgi:hypothetical protein
MQDVYEAFADCKNNAIPVSTRLTFKTDRKFLTEKLTVISNSIRRERSDNIKSIYKTGCINANQPPMR